MKIVNRVEEFKIENKDEKRINIDEMVVRIRSWQDNNLQMKYGREAVKLKLLIQI